MNISQDVMSVILAGGQGTRLFPLTIKRCKPAVVFGSRYRLIDIPISNSLNSGIRHIGIVSQYFAAELNHHIASTFHLDQFQQGRIDFLCPEETMEKKVWFAGTADAVRQNLGYLFESKADYFLILSGDQLYKMDYRPLIQFAIEKNADLVVASLPVCEKEATRMGLLKVDKEYRITEFSEKPSEQHILDKFRYPYPNSEPRYLGSMGIYVFKREALASVLKEKGDDFGHDIIPLQVKKGNSFGFIFEGYWEDIGTIASFYHANLALTTKSCCLDLYNEKMPIYSEPLHLPGPVIVKTHIEQSILGQGSLIQADQVIHSLIGIRSQIEQGSILRDTLVLGAVCSSSKIGKHCLLEKTIIDENVTLGDGVRLTNQHQLSHFDGDGIYVRDGIIIVTTGTHLPHGFSF
jgi:glucose-1-phosphate adenylyltransferase